MGKIAPLTYANRCSEPSFGSDPWYTVPFIHDQSTGVVVSESFDIVQYLDMQYPSPPRVITPGTLAFETAYYNYFIDSVWSKLPRPIHPHLYKTISPKSAAYIKELREAAYGDTFVNMEKDPQPQWDAYKEVYGSVALPTYKNAEGIFLKGNEPGWADFVTASWILFLKLLFGKDSKEWKYAETWHDGRWMKLIKDLEPYAYVDE